MTDNVQSPKWSKQKCYSYSCCFCRDSRSALLWVLASRSRYFRRSFSTSCSWAFLIASSAEQQTVFQYLSIFNKKAQLLLGKMHYNLCSSCCSTDLQGHPRSMKGKGVSNFLLVINSNLGPISNRFSDMASLRLKTCTFHRPLRSTRNMKLFPLHCIPQILYIKRTNYLCKICPLWPNA